MAYESGKTYFFIPTLATRDAEYNRAILNKEVQPLSLNTQGVGNHYNNRNVNVWSLDWSTDMQWQVVVYNGFARVLCAGDTSYGLDYYWGQNNAGNCDIYKVAGNEEDSKINFITVNAQNNLYKIQSYRNDIGNNRYLTVMPGSDGSFANGCDVRWQPLDESKATQQTWWLVPVEDVTGSTNPPGPSGEYTGILARNTSVPTGTDSSPYIVNNIPDHDERFAPTYIENGCEFHPGSGLSNGMDFNNSTDGEKIKQQLRKYIKLVFGEPNLTMEDKDLCYYLFGERKENGNGYEFHPGVDISYAEGKPIHALYGGTVVYSNYEDFGTVSIEVPELEIVTTYLHMKRLEVSVDEPVNAGDIIGYQSGRGDVSDTDFPSHLHFEIAPYGNTDGYEIPINSTTTQMPTILPYGYMDGEI